MYIYSYRPPPYGMPGYMPPYGGYAPMMGGRGRGFRGRYVKSNISHSNNFVTFLTKWPSPKQTQFALC